ncbi:guanitoxin biosynthesis L-enduracididine beta-hydroxylase GntD [Amycolatopsis sp.]|uniref:guanitoxin biosynthesis L-enduracididine beta-hydroxylase GntD n=1 Tax=Amycolatopsis sp. TaxID=37632 RepID=UPI002D805C19|nr:guanitoxin biosynthesis L-enduracididine beta-hydroxylase GntD [Amycolatopsis sp.]HET6711183.1 guanitoxin biosynthesis L-enduracididine beta-hydroxylase GntD [Amycolatopsis sp.]
MLTLSLSDDEIADIGTLVDRLARRFETVESPEFQRESRVYSEELPRRVRRTVNEFRLTEPAAALLVSGLPVVEAELGPTPATWEDKPVPSPTLHHDIAFFLIAGLLGDPIAWATQQAGYIMHDVFPIAGHENEQIGFGSEVPLAWHTEDAYHPLRTDYLGLMCLRNPDAVGTTLADVADLEIDDRVRKILAQERFCILPDDSHRVTGQGNGAAHGGNGKAAQLAAESRARVTRALESPEAIAVLFGAEDDPYLQVDPHYMTGVQAGPTETEALEALAAAVEAKMTSVILNQGDILFVDNYRAVHGRKAFRARKDGTDRWLRRLNVARDLRKSRKSRLTAESRVIY